MIAHYSKQARAENNRCRGETVGKLWLWWLCRCRCLLRCCCFLWCGRLLRCSGFGFAYPSAGGLLEGFLLLLGFLLGCGGLLLLRDGSRLLRGSLLLTRLLLGSSSSSSLLLLRSCNLLLGCRLLLLGFLLWSGRLLLRCFFLWGGSGLCLLCQLGSARRSCALLVGCSARTLELDPSYDAYSPLGCSKTPFSTPALRALLN